MKKSLTPLLTTACAATIVGIVSLGAAEPAEQPEVTPFTEAPRAAADTTNEAAASLREQVHVATVRAVNETDLDQAAYRWHERLEEARQEVHERARRPARPVQPRETTQERRNRYDREMQMKRQRDQRLRQIAAQRRQRQENESIFTRSRSFRRYGSAYPANGINREMRRVRRRSINSN
ncbi:MAG: hypothetical protein GY715_16310 [Planctomycetes bacterium]|nr:hypothetical protein [Planctomycetota bacterium]